MKRVVLLYACLASGLAEADSLGRLFTTAAERIELDQRRHHHTGSRSADATADTQFSVQGLVARHGQGRVSWINGRPAYGRAATAEGWQVHRIDGRAVTLRAPAAQRTITLRPGQRNSQGRTLEAFEGSAGPEAAP